MSSSLLLFNAVASLLSAALYAFVGSVVAGRDASPDGRTALRAFGAFWWGLALTNLSVGLNPLLLALDVEHVGLHEALLYVRVPAFGFALWGLIYYLLYIYTGRRGLSVPLAVTYAVFSVALLALYATADAAAVGERNGWVVFTWVDPPPAILRPLVLLVIVLPVIGGSVAYASLFLRARSATQRYRIALVSVAFIVWFLVFFLSSIGGQDPRWLIASRVINLLAPCLVIVAYRPPRWVRARIDFSDGGGA